MKTKRRKKMTDYSDLKFYLEMTLLVIIIFAGIAYISQKIFKCYINCSKKGSKTTSTFKAKFGDMDTPRPSPQTSEGSEEPPSPLREDEQNLLTT
jgi:hypothetical protein